jgi:hypothetical protein
MQETANSYLWKHQSFLNKLYDDVIDPAYTMKCKDCIVSTRAVSSNKASGPRRTKMPYPVIKRKCPDNACRRFYCHHISFMQSHRNTNSVLWDTKKYQISHDCHNPAFIKQSHLSLVLNEENKVSDRFYWYLQQLS